MAQFTQPFVLNAATSGPGPAASGSFINADFTAPTGKVFSPYLFGRASSTIGDLNFGLLNVSGFVTAASQSNVPLLRLNCNAGGQPQNTGPPWPNAMGNNPPNTFTQSILDPLKNHLREAVGANCRIVVGFGGWSGASTGGWTTTQFAAAIVQAANYLNSPAGGNLNLLDWEIMNEWDGDINQTTYNSYFIAASNALKAVNGAYKLWGPVSPDNPPEVSALVNACTSSQLDYTDLHKYNYCQGSPGDPTPSDAQLCAGQDGLGRYYPDKWASDINPQLVSYAAGRPTFMGEYNVSCAGESSGGVDRDITLVGALFVAHACLGSALTTNTTLYAGVWEWGCSGGYGMFAPNGNYNASSYSPNPPEVFLSKASGTMPGNVVVSNNQGNVTSWASVNGAKFGLTMVNAGTGTVSGQVALSHWPVNSSGNGAINKWTLSSSSNGSQVSLNVTAGMTDSISLPGQSITILWA